MCGVLNSDAAWSHNRVAPWPAPKARPKVIKGTIFAGIMQIILSVQVDELRAAERGLDYEELARRVEETHPEYRSMQLEVAAAETAVSGARALPDPTFKLELMEIDPGSPNLAPSQVGATKYTYGQMFPLWGKRGLRAEVAEANVQVAEARTLLTLAELRSMLRMAFAEFYAARKATQINDEVLSLLQDMQLSAQSRYANGLAAQQDVIKVKAEQTMVRVEQEMLKGEEQGARVLLNTLIGEPPDGFLAEPLALPAVDSLLITYEGLREDSAWQAPVLAAADATVRGRQAARDLAKRELLPDLGVEISPVQVGDELDAWELMFEMSIPLFAGKRAMASEAGYMLAAAEEKRAAERLRVSSEAGRAIADFVAAVEQERVLQQELLAETKLNFRSALAGYQSGQVDFDTVIEAERQIRQARLLALAATVRQQRAAAQFERITGLNP